jgi:hypothetical protein
LPSIAVVSRLYDRFMAPWRNSYRPLTYAPLPSVLSAEGSRSMYDTLMLALGVGSFALFLGYSALCLKL